jgi:hypothetical protein
MAMLPLLLLLVVFSGSQYNTTGPSRSGPQATTIATCPWLTEGSAARALGGDVNATAASSSAQEGSCRFVRRNEPSDSLEVKVSENVLPACPAKSTPLTGIGNEAENCISGSHDERTEIVSGRVRDLYFTLALVVHGQKRAAKSSDPQDDALEHLAEQVAGNLF